MRGGSLAKEVTNLPAVCDSASNHPMVCRTMLVKALSLITAIIFSVNMEEHIAYETIDISQSSLDYILSK